MKLLAVTYGTEGDARPLAALCAALNDVGHETRLLAAEGTLGAAASLGVAAQPLAGDIKTALAGREAMRGAAQALTRLANASTEAWTRDALAAGEGCDAIIVSGVAAFVGLSVAERLGVKAIGAGLIPITPTGAFASPFLPAGALPGSLNRQSHRLVNAMVWRLLRKATNAARARVLRLPPRGRVWDDHPMLYGVSPSLLPRPADWPANALVCGQWTVAEGAWSPPADLTRFLGAGEAPVYVGFGSMTGFDPPRFRDALVAGAEGRRVLFHPGWSGVGGADLPGNIFVVGETPHSWLFPRTSVVVHHGGSGTSHSATRAGAPSVAAPFAGDQAFWAWRLRQVGVAGAPIDGRRLRGPDLARAIAFAERDTVRARARDIGHRMAAEDGLAVAVRAIEGLIGS